MIGQFAEFGGKLSLQKTPLCSCKDACSLHVCTLVWRCGIQCVWLLTTTFTIIGEESNWYIKFIGERLFIPQVAIPSLQLTLHRPDCVCHSKEQCCQGMYAPHIPFIQHLMSLHIPMIQNAQYMAYCTH